MSQPKKLENVLRAEYEFSDDPLKIAGIDGIYDAIHEVAETQEAVIVECEDRIPDYKVYWNTKTGTVRVGAYALCASYEVPEDYTADTSTAPDGDVDE